MKRDELLKHLHDLYIINDCDKYGNAATSVDSTKNDSQRDLNVTETDESNLNINNQHDSKPITKSYADAVATINKSVINKENHCNFDQSVDKDCTSSVENKNVGKYCVSDKHDDVITEQKAHATKSHLKREVKNYEGLTMHYLIHLKDGVYKNIRMHVEIEALSGAKAIVPQDNYHGFSESSGSIYCKVCMKMVTDKDVHMYEDEHLIKIQRPIENVNFYRQVS